MELEPNKYYHLYNRSNNHELLFRNRDNYIYFLSKYKKYLSPFVNTLAYCLMPDHFHFSVYVKSNDSITLKKSIGLLLSSYTKAINKSFSRVGSLFQQHTKTKLIEDDKSLLTVISYIHQNPKRKNLVNNLEDWEFSSYQDYIGLREGTLVDKTFIQKNFTSIESFKLFSLSKVEKNKFIYELH
ncbi:MAG: transposase [Ignavibacteriales bacterium]|nr:MAG: transposase [Ignavibacteriales bacterium]